MLNVVENMIRVTNKEAIEKHGIRKIARRLFWFHKILNQSFMIGTLTVLRQHMMDLFPEDKKGLRNLEGLDDNAQIFVRLGDNEEIALEWKVSTNLYSPNYIFTSWLRIDFPPIGSDDPIGKTTVRFEVEQVNKKALSDDKKLKEEREVLERMFNIRRVLIAKKFPKGSFNMSVGLF